MQALCKDAKTDCGKVIAIYQKDYDYNYSLIALCFNRDGMLLEG